MFSLWQICFKIKLYLTVFSGKFPNFFRARIEIDVLLQGSKVLNEIWKCENETRCEKGRKHAETGCDKMKVE